MHTENFMETVWVWFKYINEQAETAMMTPSNYIRAAAMHNNVNALLDGKAIAKERDSR